MLDKPRLRPVEIFPVQQDGQTFVYLKDPANFAAPIGLSPVGYFILSHFDGRHTCLDIQEAYAKQFGSLLVSDELQKFIEMLDQHHYLQSEVFETHRKAVILDFRRQPTRAAAHVGGVYKADVNGLKAQLDGYFLDPKGPGLPSPAVAIPTPKAIVAPHIDFHRGGPAYAWAYKNLAESEGADLYIILGTSHCGGEMPYILTLKDFETPLGTVSTDREFVQRLQSQNQADFFADEYLHRGEHSIEFQVLYLKYIAQKRAELTGEAERPFKIVPILVSSFHALMMAKKLPETSDRIATFLRNLRSLAEADQRRVCYVAGVDLAHVGQQFGDREPVDDAFLRWVGDEDQKLVERLAALDAPGFFHEIAKDEDKRKICGFSPLYSLIHLLDGARGNNLHYGQAFTAETGSAVTFTSMIFR